MEVYYFGSYSRTSRLLVNLSDPGRILRVYGIPYLQGYRYTFTTRYHLEYNGVTRLRMKKM